MVYEVPDRAHGAPENRHRRDDRADQGRAERDVDVNARDTEVYDGRRPKADALVMESVYDGLLAQVRGGRLSWADPDTGKPIFELKKKDMANYGREGIYYLFKVYERNFPSEEKKNEFYALGFSVIKYIAGRMKIPLYDFDEITERSQEAVIKLQRKGVDIESKQVDVEIKVMDHGTGDIRTLTVGVQALRVQEEK